MKIPEHSTIIAPASLHLALYQKILAQYGGTFNIEVITLSAFLQRYAQQPEYSDFEQIYRFREALQAIDPENVFSTSRKDPAFLRACLNFLKDAQYEGIDTFPDDTKKEQDLKSILDILNTIDLPEKTESELIYPNLDSVYILPQEYGTADRRRIRRLIDAGAHWLENNTAPIKAYYSAANARRQAQLAADLIIQNDWEAEDIFIALSDPKDLAVLTQMLENRGIPYTALSAHKDVQAAKQWSALLRWIRQPDEKQFRQLLHALYPSDLFLEEVLDQFPETFPDFEKTLPPYEENVFIDEFSYARLQDLTARARDWRKTHPLNWDIHHLDQAAADIQAILPATDDNRRCFARIETLIQEAMPYLHEPEDLDPLIDAVENISDAGMPSTISGVLIGTRSQISSLRPITFLLGATAARFPAYQQYTGIFNEAYYAKTSLPALADRLEEQRQQLFHVLSQPEQFIAIVPEYDYQSAELQPSSELEHWMGQTAHFVSLHEYDTYSPPAFTLSQKTAEELFFPDHSLHGSVSRFETFANCPLKHYLQYGLRLREERDQTDLRIRGSLLHRILEQTAKVYGSHYAEITEKELQTFVDHEFEWVLQTFPSSAYWLTAQKNEVMSDLTAIFTQLAAFESEWHMRIDAQEHKIRQTIVKDGYTISFTGYIDRIDASETSFCVFDYKTGSRTLRKADFESGRSLQLAVYTVAYQQECGKLPVGAFYITLSTSPEEEIGVKSSYNSKKNIWQPVEEASLQEKFRMSFTANGWTFQDLSTYADNVNRFKSSKGLPSFETMRSQQEEILSSIGDEIRTGNIKPDHAAGACTFCPYRPICRNAEQEVSKPSRLKEE